jgi:hypothetical protein
MLRSGQRVRELLKRVVYLLKLPGASAGDLADDRSTCGAVVKTGGSHLVAATTPINGISQCHREFVAPLPNRFRMIVTIRHWLGVHLGFYTFIPLP